ncbi:Major facilitator superfamily multidrug transporter mdrA [Pseudocercospora fuligena]|uniref:Major facilitator superfamily multidrug transporter mdrA n=1 Tax=Pseudocercospora fuligena TaxID=685502 RepID=A0A8H6RJD4_9PEZI|nr:Major facilitator superfamily multidrug transporter mdrA [Pseudocercospora fuligena]
MQMEEHYGVSQEIGVLGLSIFTLGMALGPLINAPASEYFGRRPIYIVSYALALPMYVGAALSPTVTGFMLSRFFTGIFQSVTIATIGGSIADLYHHHDTGYPMSIFLWAATGGSSLAFLLFSFVAQYRPWPDTMWAIMGVSGGIWVISLFCMGYAGETRHSVILRRRAAKLRKQTGDQSIDVAPEHRRKGLKDILWVTQTRPYRFLATEPVIQFGAIYNGYYYGLSFLLNGAFTLVFGEKGHGLEIYQVGLCFLGIFGGITAGPFINIWQERYYQKRRLQEDGGNIPEARLRMSKVAAIAHPISLFWFAWTTYKSVNPAVPVLATALWGWSFYTLILMTYQYTEDAYKEYSASALAGLGLIRNLAGAGFPLFGNQMFENEGYQWAGSILAFLALVMVPIPFILDKYGKRLRQRSPWAAQHMDDVE